MQTELALNTSRLRILHISDLHVGCEQAEWRWQGVLGESWIENIQIIANDAPPDLLVFTGDLTQSGAVAEFDRLSVWLDELLNALKLSKDRLLVVPGNHDITRSVDTLTWEAARLAFRRSDHPLAAARLAMNKNADISMDALFARQKNYRDWAKQYGLSHVLPSGEGHPYLGYRHTYLTRKGAVHVIGLDSAWLAGDDHDRAHLRLVDDQVGKLMTADGKPLDGIRIVLLHHPFADLVDGEERLAQLENLGANLILHGHVHKARALRLTTTSDNEKASLRVLSSGCLYQSNTYKNCIQVLDLDLAAGGKLVQVWRRSSSELGKWFSDNEGQAVQHDGRVRLASAAASGAHTKQARATFSGPCTINSAWLASAGADLALAASWSWYPAIESALALVERHHGDLDQYLYQINARELGWISGDRSRFFDAYSALDKVRELARSGYAKLLAELRKVKDPEVRSRAIQTFLVLAAQKMMCRLQRFENALLIGDRLVVKLFPEYSDFAWQPMVCLPETDPACAAYGMVAAGGFLACEVRVQPAASEDHITVYLPWLYAQNFHDVRDLPDLIYFGWIRPQMLQMTPSRIAVRKSMIMSIRDADNTTRQLKSDPTPWHDKPPRPRVHGRTPQLESELCNTAEIGFCALSIRRFNKPG